MKKIYIKYKILVNGFFVNDSFKCDEFILKDGYLNENYFKEKSLVVRDFPIDLNRFIIDCLVDYKTYRFKYFESEDFIEFEVSNKFNKANIGSFLVKKSEIIQKIFDLEQKLRLRFNIPILFPITLLEIHDENKKLLSVCQTNARWSSWNRADYPIGYQESFNNSRFDFDLNSMRNIKDFHFKRAIEFYNESFESDNIAVRFILIFSSLEAIFNLDGKKITEKLSKYSAKLLSEDNLSEYDKISEDMTNLYGKRCNYVHGTKLNCITVNDEILLRRYARKIIIAYWLLMNNSKMTARQILEYLDSNQKLDIQTRLIISALNAQNFSEQQNKLVNLIEKEIGTEIPKQTKDKILEKCDK